MTGIPKKIYTITHAAEVCGLNRVTLWRWIKSGKLQAYQTPTGHFRLRQDDLENFIQNDLQYLNVDVSKNQNKILVIDDEPQFRKLVRKIFSNSRFEIEEAGNGFEAGLKIMKFIPSILILDLFMPDMNGFDICRLIKSDPNTRKIKIIVVTGLGTQEIEDQIRQMGADAYLQKPVGSRDLKKCVEKLA